MACGVKLINCVRIFASLVPVLGIAFAQDAPPLAPLPKLATQGRSTSSAAPPEVVAEAVAAVNRLGDEVVLGRYQVAIERMNPQWKERTARRIGGMAVLEQKLAAVAREMLQQGVSMISFKPQGQPRSFEVDPGKKEEIVNGELIENLIFKTWLVLIPTATKFRIMIAGEIKPRVIENIGFQVAICEKGKNNWTFIDGSGLSVNDLRELYFTLPQDLQLPQLARHEAH